MSGNSSMASGLLFVFLVVDCWGHLFTSELCQLPPFTAVSVCCTPWADVLQLYLQYRSEQNYSSSVSEAWPLDWMFFSQAPTLGDAGFEPGTSAIAVCHSYQLRHPSPFVVLIRINIYFLTNKWILLEGKIIPPYYDKLAGKEGVIRGGVRRPNTNRGQETVLLVLFFCFICIQVLCYFLLICYIYYTLQYFFLFFVMCRTWYCLKQTTFSSQLLQKK